MPGNIVRIVPWTLWVGPCCFSLHGCLSCCSPAGCAACSQQTCVRPVQMCKLMAKPIRAWPFQRLMAPVDACAGQPHGQAYVLAALCSPGPALSQALCAVFEAHAACCPHQIASLAWLFWRQFCVVCEVQATVCPPLNSFTGLAVFQCHWVLCVQAGSYAVLAHSWELCAVCGGGLQAPLLLQHLQLALLLILQSVACSGQSAQWGDARGRS